MPLPSRRRILRVGILLNRSLVEERQMREHANITVGQSAKNTFSIPLEGMPRQFTIFQAEPGGKYRLNFTKSMEGRISDGGQPLKLSDLKNRGAEDKGEFWSWPLPETARGKIEMGECTLLFQFVAEPPRQPKPMLPASVRGTLSDRIDIRLAVIVTLSLLIHAGVAGYAMFIEDPEKPNGIADRAYNLTFKPQEVTIEVAPPPKPATDTSADKNVAKTEKAAPKAEKAAPSKDPTPSKDPGPPPKDDAGRKAAEAVALQEQAKAFADQLTADDESATGTLGGMNDRKPGGDLSKQISAVRDSGATVAVGGGSGRGTRGDPGARVGTGKGPALSGQGEIASAGADKVEKQISGRISVSSKPTSDDDSSLTPDMIMSKIQSAYMSGLQRCYKDYLKKDPSARGKIQVSFTVNASGHATSNKASGLAPEVEECVQSRMAGWSFAVPKDSDGKPTTAGFSLGLQLVPE